MCEFLVLAKNNSIPAGRIGWRPGSPVRCEDDGFSWGSSEGLPDFYLVKVPGMPKAFGAQYLESWAHDPVFKVIDSNEELDTLRIKTNISKVSATGKGALVREKSEEVFTRWGAAVVDWQADQVVFDLSIYGAITSDGFWLTDASKMVLSQTKYIPLEGAHRVRIESSPYRAQDIATILKKRQCLQIPPDSFATSRETVKEHCLTDIEDRLRQVKHAKCRWYAPPAAMQAIADAGGTVTIDQPRFLANIRDGLLD